MGEVYRARDLRLNRDVAIKVLPASFSADSDWLRRFEQEARAAAALNHPNILAVYQLGTFEGVPYMVTELLEGETLRERLKRGPLPLRKVVDYGVQIARGLAAAHEKGIIHRDLKPENLFLTKDGQVKILDFGLARVTRPKETLEGHPLKDAALTEAGWVMGTVGYMSPEQVRGENTDHRSDIFAFSAVLHEMLAGKRTFQKPTSVETMTAILNEEPQPIAQLAPSTPLALQRVLHRGLEKNPEQRFQSASDLGFALESLSDDAPSSLTAHYAIDDERPSAIRTPIVGIVIVALVALGIFAYFSMRPTPVPQVSNYVQLTHDGLQKVLVGTDGSRIFLSVIDSGVRDAAAIQISGGEQTKIPMPSEGMVPVDLSADGSAFLIVDGHGYPGIGPFWSLPVLGNSPRRLGEADGQVAAWSANSKMLAYANGTDVFLAKADGTEARKLATMKTMISDLVWSPNGKHLRVGTTEITQSQTAGNFGEQAIWEVAADGSNPHRLLAGWVNAANACCGKWTADGDYFVFQAEGQIWALPKDGRFLHKSQQPIQLTSSPMSLHSPLPSKDGTKLFVVGRSYRGELTQFNLKSGASSPFFGGVSAEWVDTSKDGTQVVYVSYPQGDLWKSKADGTERVQLTFAPFRPVLPRLSPDGRTIVFFQFPDGPTKPGHMYLISPNGGTPRELMPDDTHNQQDPTWSADGKQIVYSGDANDASPGGAAAIRVLDVQTRRISSIAGSQGLFSPRCSPDGKLLLAMTSDSNALKLYDFHTQTWSELAKGTFSWPTWSRDGQYIYVKDLSQKGALDRIKISDRKIERAIDLKDFVLTGVAGGSVSVAPDDSPLLLRDRGTQDVYALDWEKP
jgi:serine/threonine protein kinase/Tol biopolymer transport system component